LYSYLKILFKADSREPFHNFKSQTKTSDLQEKKKLTLISLGNIGPTFF
jgi:hypothetical protein